MLDSGCCVLLKAADPRSSKAGCSRSLEYSMIARIAALLACRAHEKVLHVLYDNYATAQHSGRSIILFLCIKLIMHMFYFLSAISCGTSPLQKVLLNAKRVRNAGKCPFFISRFPFPISISLFLVLPVPIYHRFVYFATIVANQSDCSKATRHVWWEVT